MKVAIVHYWLINMRGGEKVLEALCRMFPEADIYTHVLDPKILSETLKKHYIKTTYINKLPFARRLYQFYLPFMPSALEQLNLNDYDLVISSESGPAKGAIVPSDTLHLCYCHSPMRYIWDQYHIYYQNAGWLGKIALFTMAPRLRIWDRLSAERIDYIVSNSNHVADRVRAYWGRKSVVVHPLVSVDDFSPAPKEDVQDYYLWLGELAPYKRPDLLVEAFNENGKELIIIGGPLKAIKSLKRRANKNISFLGKTDFETLKIHLSQCKALIFPGEEDFGIVPVEAMASGRPVVAYGRGGALDTVIDGKTGVLFYEQTPQALNAAIKRLETEFLPSLNVASLTNHAQSFRENNFRDGMMKALHTADPLRFPRPAIPEAASR